MHPALELKHNLSKIISILEEYNSKHGMDDLFKYLAAACEKKNTAEVAFILDKIIAVYEKIIEDMQSHITISTQNKNTQIENLAALKEHRKQMR